MNNTDPAIGIAEDQCVRAQNVEFVESLLGERRLGTTAISLPAFLSGRDRVSFLFRHLPTADESAAELWALGVTGTTAAALGRKTTSWSEIAISDTPVLTGVAQYRWEAVTLHGKIHFAYKSNVNRLHVWDGTTMRRSGLTAPAGPTAANAGSGSLTGARYGRVRYVVLSGSTTRVRSEPSEATPFTPSGTGASITWTKPASITEGETHWEIELSTDNATFYRMAQIPVATTTYTDSAVFATGYVSGTLSEDLGDYTPAWSARYLSVDGDRLLWAGSWEDEALASRVGWSPVFGAEGVGTDERMETDTDPTLDLDTSENGPITGISPPVLGAIWVFKQHAIYKLTRSGKRTAAYDADKFTDALGAIHGSIESGLDETGQPCLYFLDHEQGPCRIGYGGIKRCGEDLRTTWQTLNMNATAVTCSRLYYPAKKQVYWNLATGANNRPDTRLVLHVDKTRVVADGLRKGWALWTGNIATALTMCLFAENIDDGTARSLTLVPFIGLEGLGLIHRCDTGLRDDGTTYAAVITTRPIVLSSLAHHFEVRAAVLLGKAVPGASVDVRCIRDFGQETTAAINDISFTPTGSETAVMGVLDHFKGVEMRVGQFQFVDVGTPGAQWQLNRFDVVTERGQTA